MKSNFLNRNLALEAVRYVNAQHNLNIKNIKF